MFQTPSERGGEALQRDPNNPNVEFRFQTPSERGGEALEVPTATPEVPTKSFKPLQSGR